MLFVKPVGLLDKEERKVLACYAEDLNIPLERLERSIEFIQNKVFLFKKQFVVKFALGKISRRRVEERAAELSISGSVVDEWIDAAESLGKEIKVLGIKSYDDFQNSTEIPD